MPIKVTCPKCGGVLHAPDDAGGKRGKCPTCATVLSIPAADGAAPGPAPFRSKSLADTPFRPPVQEREPLADSPPRPSVPSLGDVRKPAPPPPRPAAKPADDLPPPPPPKGKPKPPAFPPGRRPTDPLFAGKPAADDTALEAKRWRRVSRGFGWLKFAVLMFALPVLALAGIALYEKLGKATLPVPEAGYLKLDGLTGRDEVTLAVTLVPVALGLLATLLGRLGVSNAPPSSYARGQAKLAAFATLAAVAGLVAYAVPTVGAAMHGTVPTELLGKKDVTAVFQKDGLTLLGKEDVTGMLQRGGLAAFAAFAAAAEGLFLVTLAKLGAGLHCHTLTGRVTRFTFLLAAAGVAGVAAYVGLGEYGRDVTDLWAKHVVPQWDQLGENKPAATAGLAAAGALVFATIYWRLLGGGKRAVRNWLEANDPR